MSYFSSWLSKPEILVNAVGWLATYYFLVRAQNKLQKDKIHHEIYKELIKELDIYAAQLTQFSTKVQAFKFTEVFRRLGNEDEKVVEWINETVEAGSNLKFYMFLQRWESYEIFVQDLNSAKSDLAREHNSMNEKFQNLFLFQDTQILIKTDKEKFTEELNKLWEKTSEQVCYVMDMKVVLQNFFYKKYDLKMIIHRKPTDPKYSILTEDGLKKFEAEGNL